MVYNPRAHSGKGLPLKRVAFVWNVKFGGGGFKFKKFYNLKIVTFKINYCNKYLQLSFSLFV